MPKIFKKLLKAKKAPIIIGIILLAVALGWFLFFLTKKSPQTIGEDKTENEIIGQEKTFDITESDNAENNVYIDSQYKFFFEYPKDFTATKFQEGEGDDTILVQKQGSKESFQIFISSFDEPGPITKERILQDLPDLIIKNPEQRVLKNGAVGLIFFSEESSVGETREIWFIYPVRSSDSNGVYNGFLYQISTYKELDILVAKILETWKFQ